ncbi:hypothetical protein F2P81_006776 [Scophthalmus maximus]|uniref:Uncharacterized protein n=1 Tax=Scophthalmus maximus TaxID=52904 RepID=A0A6A4T925_SCOMX|nr:hypothetical protein F2P81_006776 [Scophthalmus maximus]
MWRNDPDMVGLLLSRENKPTIRAHSVIETSSPISAANCDRQTNRPATFSKSPSDVFMSGRDQREETM